MAHPEIGPPAYLPIVTKGSARLITESTETGIPALRSVVRRLLESAKRRIRTEPRKAHKVPSISRTEPITSWRLPLREVVLVAGSNRPLRYGRGPNFGRQIHHEVGQ